MTAIDTVARAPWHFWLVQLIAALWNGFGAYDFVMSNAVGEGYLHQMGMTDTQIANIQAHPPWLTAVWATGVGGDAAESRAL
jgi:hypothetical protein